MRISITLIKTTVISSSPKVDFIGRSNFNNGVTEKVDLIEDIKPYEAGNLTLSLGGVYLEYCKKFIATVIFKESPTYYKAFENELNRHIKRDFSICLPVKSDNSPDWQYMEEYMKKLETSIKNMIKANNNFINVS